METLDLTEQNVITGQVAKKLGVFECDIVAKPVEGGHMAYRRQFLQLPGRQMLFAKGHDPTLFTDQERADHARQYLKKRKNVF